MASPFFSSGDTRRTETRMYIKSIELQNFRNYSALALEPCEGVNVFAGANAQGKTNILESVYLTGTGRSHRTHNERELIMWGGDFARVEVKAEKRDGSHEVAVIIPAAGRRVIKIAGNTVSRSGELMGHVACVIFSPEDLSLIKEGPAERRRFMDIAISQLRPRYYYELQRYNHALKQRNEILKNGAYNLLDAFDEELAKSGEEIMRQRQWFSSLLNEKAGGVHAHIALERENLTVSYRPGIKADLLSELIAARDFDISRQTTSVGPHRDELMIKISGREARVYASQGQQRTAALSLRLSELSVMRDEMGEWPVLMLDDVMSELDPDRRRSLIGYLKDVQTFITCTDANDLADAEIGRLYSVENGEVKEPV